jgi:hypothetical protein
MRCQEVQRLLIVPERLAASCRRTSEQRQSFADLLEVSSERVRLWMLARAAAEPRETWRDEWVSLARALG